jgi:hypothetical protein
MSDEQVLVHVRFAPNGAVTEISERPAAVSLDAWFNYLTERIGEQFQPLSGGRGVFRSARGEIDGFKTALAG